MLILFQRFRMRHAGFTLIELLIALLIMAVMATAATYSYREWLAYADAARAQVQLTSAITVAESYALSSRRIVTLCKTLKGNTCDAANWSQGLLVFFDDDNQHQVLQEGDRIKVLPAIGSGGSLSFYGFPSSNYWQYQPVVSKEQQNGTFVYCDNRQMHNDWRLVISKTGRYRIDKTRDERC
jgi:prepilin-type N-terminal cleavage/methylation domain-containing protein